MACIEARCDMPASSRRSIRERKKASRYARRRDSRRILSEDGKIKGMEFLEVESFGFDDEKNLSIETVDGSHHVLEGDTVIFAIGQRPEIPDGFGLELRAGSSSSILTPSRRTGTRSSRRATP